MTFQLLQGGREREGTAKWALLQTLAWGRGSAKIDTMAGAAMDKIKTEFAGRHFTADVILWAVRWYLQFPIS